jgi:Transposase DDE domain
MPIVIPDLWKKLPFAEAFWQFFKASWPDEALQALFDRHRGRGYERKLTFVLVVRLLCESIVLQRGRLLPTMLHWSESGGLAATIQAIYQKIGRMPRAVSHALVCADAQRLAELCPDLRTAPDPKATGVAKYNHLIFDGHTLKEASKRLKAVRQVPGRALGGKILAVLHRASNLVVGCVSHPHAHTNDQKLLPDALAQVRAAVPGPRLWIADRLFGNLANFKRCTQDGDACLLRKTQRSEFTPEKKGVFHGTDRRGRVLRDEPGILRSSREGQAPARQITVIRPGESDLVLLTSLTDRDTYPADELLELYAERWTIEEKFQKVRELFTLGPYASAHPDGMLFQTALCLMLSNQLHALQTLMAKARNIPVPEVSTHRLFEDLREQLVTCKTLLTPELLVTSLEDRIPPGKSLLDYVLALLKKAWRPRHRKSPPKKRHTPKAKHKRGTGGHFSIHKKQMEQKEKEQQAKAKDEKPDKDL